MLLEEYKHLKAADVSDLHDTESEIFQLQQLHRTIKSALAPIYNEPQYEAQPIEEVTIRLPDISSLHTERPSVSPAPHQTRTVSPQLKGATLEEATVALLRHLFQLSAGDANAVSTRIRRQGSGYQFGHDISFTAPAATNEVVKCHVECKNYRRPIRPADIADKLLQQRMAARGAPIDHWILISPHTDPSNDLAEMLREWETEPYWDFCVHVWSPASGIQNLFALDPQVYRAVYNNAPPSVDDSSVLAEFRRRITPRLRMHPGLAAYLREPWRMCFATEDAAHFTDLLVDHVDLGTIDIAGRPIDKPLQKVVDSWLQAETPSTMLLLGEFGDGKSFFTYMQCRELAQHFLDRSHHSRFPVRLALRDLRTAGSAEKAIEDWLRTLGVPMADWLQLAAEHPTLIVLDGFDEMTAELDPPTISHNLRLLAQALDSIAGTSTVKNKTRKVLVTSRGRFFDQPREEAALREMLGFPTIVRIRPLSRTEVLAHLSRYAREINAEERLAKIQILYDPIGLAAKPLFLQMIKETLQDLPEDNFGALTLYERYIERSLRRKSALLLGGEAFEPPSATIDGMRRILEQVAIRLHSGSTDHVNLRDLEQVDGQLADMLWQMASQSARPTNAEPDADRADDARMRVSIRSLLRPIPSNEPNKWPVNFFHRSMSEFFLADGVARALQSDNLVELRNALGANPLSAETVDFVIERLNAAGDVQRISARLESLARGALRSLNAFEALGGNALTLHLRLAGRLSNKNWSGLRLDNVSLTGADLQGFDFSNSSLRFANLDNADLRQANLSGTDLTGLRVEQTTLVQAVVIDRETRIIVAAYSDGTVREWRPTGTGRWTAQTVFAGLDEPVRQLVLATSTIVVALMSSEAWILARTEPEWTVSSRTPTSPYLRDLHFDKDGIVSSLQVFESGFERYEVRISTGTQSVYGAENDSILPYASLPRHRFINMFSEPNLIRGEWFMSDFFTGVPEGSSLWNLTMEKRYPIAGESGISSFDIVRDSRGNDILYAGTINGRLGMAPLTKRPKPIQLRPISSGQHDGPITAVDALDKNLIVTGGSDRCIRVWHSVGSETKVQALYLKLRCRGAILDGVEGQAELALLRRLSNEDEADVSINAH